MKRNKQLETQSKSGSNLNLLICIATVESPYVTEALGGIQFNAARPLLSHASIFVLKAKARKESALKGTLHVPQGKVSSLLPVHH